MKLKLFKKIKPKLNIKTTLSISLFGILLLLFLSEILSPKPINIENINNKLLNKKVQVQGQIFNIRTYEDSNFQIISIKDETGKIDITKEIRITGRAKPLANNQNILVIGKIKEYKQYLQIQADKIVLINPSS